MATLTFFKPLIHTVKKYLKPSHNYYIEPAKTSPALEVNSNSDIISWRPKAAFKLQTLVKALIDKGIDINNLYFEGQTPLHLAIKVKDLETVKFLVQAGGKIAPNKGNWSAIHVGIKVGNLEIVEYLYENTEFGRYDEYGWSLLHWAAASGNTQIVQFFLDKDHNPNVITDNHKTPLELAVESKNISSVKALISKGAKFDIKSELGYKIFELAIDSEDMKLIKYLVNHTLVGKNTGQQTLLEKVAQIYDKNINISKLVKVLIKDNAGFDKALGQKLLQKAIYADDLELVETLYSRGADAQYKDQLGRSGLHHAIKANCGEELIQFLIEHTTDINYRDKSGLNPLGLAKSNNCTVATKLLLEAGAYEGYMYDDVIKVLGECGY
ncbi:ankyrin repeat family protein [Rickettsia hoogstraalii str. RCCE3]|nr:ankyrin repeat family protein [Rickettsia hoogstraalii str. RCCE3]